MCTLILLDRVVPGAPIVVAANRDEYFSRPSAPPAHFPARQPGKPDFVAPQDLEAGGTWMGVNAHGLFAGLTNRPLATPDRSRRSRGELVIDALAHSSSRDAADALRAAGPEFAYNPFHLLVADGHDTRLAVLDQGGLEQRSLEPGVHVVCNRDEDDPVSGKARWIRGRVEALDFAAPWPALSRALVSVLRSHPNPDSPLENPCVHAPGYGSRFSALVAVGPARRGWWAAEGTPCETKFRNYSRLLEELEPVRV